MLNVASQQDPTYGLTYTVGISHTVYDSDPVVFSIIAFSL